MTREDAFASVILVLLDDPEVAERVAERLAPYLAPTPADESWMSTSEAAKYLGLSTHALHRLTAAGRVPKHQDGPNCRCWFLRSELDAWRRGELGRLNATQAA